MCLEKVLDYVTGESSQARSRGHYFAASSIRERRSWWGEVAGVAGDAFGDA